MERSLEDLSMLATSFDGSVTGPSRMFMMNASPIDGHRRLAFAGVMLCDHGISHGFWEMRASSVLIVPAGPRYVGDKESQFYGYRIDQLLTSTETGYLDYWSKIKEKS